jgi:hypothetical protein
LPSGRVNAARGIVMVMRTGSVNVRSSGVSTWNACRTPASRTSRGASCNGWSSTSIATPSGTCGAGTSRTTDSSSPLWLIVTIGVGVGVGVGAAGPLVVG